MNVSMNEEMFASVTDPCNSTGNETYPTYLGFIGAGVSVVFYASNFIPVKKFETGDGMFFQWILCSAILLVGMVLQAIRRSTFYPIVMVGGAVWATGNVCVVPIIKTIGLGLGICIWGTFNLLAGWASGRFGWFGINAEVPGNVTFNYIGVALSASSAFIYAFIKPEIDTPKLEMTFEISGAEVEPLIPNNQADSRSASSSLYGNPSDDVIIFNKKKTGSVNQPPSLQAYNRDDETFLDRLGPIGKRVLGVVLSVVSGVFYGLMFVPAIYIKDTRPCASQNLLDYVFAHFCGIYLASTFYFLLYCAVNKNRPKIYPKVILPGIVSGVMWAVATGFWFIANSALSEPVSFPIITTVPAAIASLVWGVLVFKEIRGRRNILILLLGVLMTLSGAILAGLSKS
ncbi:transmembrane protein 144-like isoform X2 [Gigantopelta aegis]|nr:transmembrane protein 144-like isoform X2 [Gigantopelta aegis]